MLLCFALKIKDCLILSCLFFLFNWQGVGTEGEEEEREMGKGRETLFTSILGTL